MEPINANASAQYTQIDHQELAQRRAKESEQIKQTAAKREENEKMIQENAEKREALAKQAAQSGGISIYA